VGGKDISLNKNKNALFAKKVVKEYIKFLKKIGGTVEETKKATAFALKKLLKLENGDSIVIKEDGSFEITKEDIMDSKEDRDSKKLTLNGRDITADELERQKEAVKNQKGARLMEVSEGNFQLRFNG